MKKSFVVWLVATLIPVALVTTEFYTITKCVAFVCFSPLVFVTFPVIFVWLIYTLHLVIPRFSSKVLRAVFITVGAIILLVPSNYASHYSAGGLLHLYAKINEPSIAILSPLPNTTIQVGKPFLIMWSSKNISPDTPLNIHLRTVFLDQNGKAFPAYASEGPDLAEVKNATSFTLTINSSDLPRTSGLKFDDPKPKLQYYLAIFYRGHLRFYPRNVEAYAEIPVSLPPR